MAVLIKETRLKTVVHLDQGTKREKRTADTFYIDTENKHGLQVDYLRRHIAGAYFMPPKYLKRIIAKPYLTPYLQESRKSSLSLYQFC